MEWSRPLGLLALALPVALLALSMRRARPDERAVATFTLWARLAREAPLAGARARRRIDAARWLVAGALAAGAVALGGPRFAGDGRAAPWRVVVDRSPSMFLAHRDERAGSGGASVERARIDVALERALAWLDAADGGTAREWIDASADAADPVITREPPRAWLEAPAAPRDEPRWERHDLARTLWITDRAPARVPAAAAVIASGGDAVPGVIGIVERESAPPPNDAPRDGEREEREPDGAAEDAAHTLDAVELAWDGARVHERAVTLPRARVALDPALPPLVRDFVRVWADARGLDLDGDGPLVLEVRSLGEGQERAVACARDGWSVAARAHARGVPASDGGLPLSAWLSAGAGDGAITLVAARAGLVATALVACEEPRGDPALFAVSWTDLLDGALVPRPGVVAVAERASAGPPSADPPLPARTDTRGGDSRPAALLAALAALLAAAALLVRVVRAA